MIWKDKIEQLIALLEKLPHPQSFDADEGVYHPYFLLELRPANWEISPYAEYTRLDGQPGKEIRLSLQIIENQKVNISQDELNFLAYIFSFNHYDNRRLFNYGQPIGFLLDWLRGSHIRLRSSDKKEIRPLEIGEETGIISLGIFKNDDGYILQPMIVFSDHALILEDKIEVLTANPTYILVGNVLFRVESNMPALFWINYFRLQQNIHIPTHELKEFINSYVAKILPALDWKCLEEHLKKYDLPLTSTKIYLQERAGQFSPEVKFVYGKIEFPAHPQSEKSLASQNKDLFIVERDALKESAVRKMLQQHGLLYIQHRWQIDPQYKIMDWIRLQIPVLKGKGIEFKGEGTLQRYRFRRGMPKLHLKIKSQADWIDVRYKIHLDGTSLNIPDFEEQLQRNKSYMKLADGSHIHFGDDFAERLTKFFKIIDNIQPSGHEKVRPISFPLVDAMIKLADHIHSDDTFQKWQKQYASFQEIQKVNLSIDFNGILRDYQKSGLDWLNFLNQFSLGGILADDMGLGKTIQVIALLLNLKQEKRLRHPALIIVPLTVLFNWENEIHRFAPKLNVVRYQGTRGDREKIAENFSGYDIVLLSYGILLQDSDILKKTHWEYLILDESQKIKNPNTKTYKAVKALKIPNRLCLTGTPVENSVTDLWAQFNFLNPGMLGTQRQFESRFGRNGDETQDVQQIFQKIINPFILRRTKEDVLEELPERTDIIQYVEMTEKQIQIYRKWLDIYRDQIFTHIELKGMPQTRLKILEALTYLRQIACHPAILDSSVKFEESGKVQLLEEMLDEIIQEGHKVLVFSQFVRFLKLAKKLLETREWGFEYLDGNTRKRGLIVNNFQKNPDKKIFLISLKAGGLGLNLTAADYVIHLDPWWNPAVEQQATDRVHRIGQQNRVFVYKYIVKNSVEEKILQLQNRKKQLFRSLIPTEKGLVKQLTREDLNFLLQE